MHFSNMAKIETTTSKKDGLKRVLEDFDKGNDVHISDVIVFIHELSGTNSETYGDDEIKENIKRKIKFEEGSEYLNLNQCMEFLANELQIDTEEEVLKAFRVFDKDNTGKISLSELKSIMEERGNPLNDDELRLIEECSRKFEDHTEPEKESEDVECSDGKPVKGGKGGEGGKGGKTSKKESKDPKVPKEGKRSKVPKEGKASKDIKEVKEGPKDVKVNYREFVKAIMETITLQESKLWGAKK